MILRARELGATVSLPLLGALFCSVRDFRNIQVSEGCCSVGCGTKTSFESELQLSASGDDRVTI
jgi:hypothetical protein